MDINVVGLLLSSIAQHFCKFWEARFESEPFVYQLSEEGDERRIDKSDKDRAGAESMESSCQGKRQHNRKEQHDDIVGELDPVDIQPKAVGDLANQKLVNGDRP